MELLISNHVNNIWIRGVKYATSSIMWQLSLPGKSSISTSGGYLFLSRLLPEIPGRPFYAVRRGLFLSGKG